MARVCFLEMVRVWFFKRSHYVWFLDLPTWRAKTGQIIGLSTNKLQNCDFLGCLWTAGKGGFGDLIVAPIHLEWAILSTDRTEKFTKSRKGMDRTPLWVHPKVPYIKQAKSLHTHQLVSPFPPIFNIYVVDYWTLATAFGPPFYVIIFLNP